MLSQMLHHIKKKPPANPGGFFLLNAFELSPIHSRY